MTWSVTVFSHLQSQCLDQTLNRQPEDREGQLAEFDKGCMGLELQTVPLMYMKGKNIQILQPFTSV